MVGRGRGRGRGGVGRLVGVVGRLVEIGRSFSE